MGRSSYCRGVAVGAITVNQQVVDKKAPTRVVKNLANRVANNKISRWAENRVKAHIDFVARQPTRGFVLAVAGWTVVFKTLLVPIVAISNTIIFAPLGLADVFSREPVLELADYLTKGLYGMQLLRWNTLSTISHLLLLGLLFPFLATLVAQVIPQYFLQKKVRSERRRALIAIAAMGLLYMLAYGEVALFISGSIIAIPLVFTFFHRLSSASLTNAYLVTSGIHAVANTIIVLFRGIFGGD